MSHSTMEVKRPKNTLGLFIVRTDENINAATVRYPFGEVQGIWCGSKARLVHLSVLIYQALYGVLVMTNCTVNPKSQTWHELTLVV